MAATPPARTSPPSSVAGCRPRKPPRPRLPPLTTQKTPAQASAATDADKAVAEKVDATSPAGAGQTAGTAASIDSTDSIDKEGSATGVSAGNDAATIGQPPEAPLMSLFMPASQALAQAPATSPAGQDFAASTRGDAGGRLPAALMVNGSNGGISGYGKPGLASTGPGKPGMNGTSGMLGSSGTLATAGHAASARASDGDGTGLTGASAGTAGKPLPGFMNTLQAATTASAAAGEKAALPMADLQAQLTPDRAITHLPAAQIGTLSNSATPAASVAIQAPLGTPGWDSQLGEHVVWISNRQLQSAEISINPPELGPMELRLTLDNAQSGQQATLQFSSPHAEVREALENALPQLREAMADAGITLGNATVGSDSFRDQAAAERQATTPGFAGPAAAPVAEASPAVIPATRRGNGLVDTFA
jgi:flagellar hook-length control protein FliK